MKLQFVSDLHLEFPDNRSWLKENMIIPNGDILLIAGDTVPDKYKKHAKFFYEEIDKKFKHVVSVMGNHEFYHGLVEYTIPKYKSQIGINHTKINNQSVIIENIKIIGSTLWTNIPSKHGDLVTNTMNDYHLIYKEEYGIKEKITIGDTNSYNLKALKYIEQELTIPFDGKIILLTHHLPLFELSQTLKEESEGLQFAYANDLRELIKKYRIDYWVFGHKHETIDMTIENTRFLSNPLGYLQKEQYRKFERGLIVEI